MKRATKGLLSFVTAFLIVFSTFGNAFLVAEASEPTAIEETVTVVDSIAEVDGDAKAATVGASKEETVTGEVTEKSNTSEKTEEIKEEANTETVIETVEETDAQKSVDLTVTASEEDGYVTLTCGVEGATILYTFNEDGSNGFKEYTDKIKLDTSKDTVLFARASYTSKDGVSYDGEKAKFEFKAAEAVEEMASESKAAVSLRSAPSESEQTAVLADEVKDGDRVIIAIDGYTMDRSFKAIKIEPNDKNEVTIDENALVLTVSKTEGTNDLWFENGGEYLAAKAGANDLLWTEKSVDTAKWVLDGDIIQNSTSKNTAANPKFYCLGIKKNDHSVFKAYVKGSSSALQHVNFYVLGEAASVSVAAPTASVENGTKVKFGDKVELSCATEGAKIMYSLDGKEFKSYESAIEITKNVTLSAYAELDAAQSEKAEFKYELLAGSKITDVTKLEDNQEFVLVFGDTTDSIKALSSKASAADKNGNTKLEGVTVKLNDDGQLVYTDKDAAPVALKAVKADEGDQYYITADITADDKTTTKYLTTLKEGNSLTFEEQPNDYSLWFFEVSEDGTFFIKSVNGEYTDKDEKKFPEYVEYFRGLFTVYSLKDTDDKAPFTFSAYTMPELVETETPVEEEKLGVKVTDLSELYNGAEFSLVYNKEKTLSSEVSGKKLAGVDAKFNADDNLVYADSYATLKLEKSDVENQYYIVSGSKFLTCPATGNGLSFVDAKDDYSLWTIEDQGEGALYIKNVNASYKDSAQFVEFYSGFTTYGFNESKKDIYTFTAYSFADEDSVNTVAKLLTRELYDGDKIVVYYPKTNKVMTAEANNGKLKDAALALSEDGTLETKDSNAVVLTVHINDNGDITFASDDNKYLTIELVEKESNGKMKTYANLVLADTLTDNSLWTQVAADDKNEGNYYLKNVNAKVGSSVQALEYYSGFSAYGFKEDPAYVFNFYALKEGKKLVSYEFDEDTSLTVAQWAGNARYEETENSDKYINGDLYATNDMLDTNAKFTAVIGGKVAQPWFSTNSNGGNTKTYFMGGAGVVNKTTDYYEFSFPSTGFGNLALGLRIKVSNAAAGSYQLQYSTDGENFNNLKKGTYSYKFTAYDGTGKSYEKSGSGDISDGIAKTSLAPGEYVEFTFEIPNAAANADNVYIRLVPGDKRADGKDGAIDKQGNARIDSVKITGNPVVDPSVAAYVKADPASGEVPEGQKVSLSSATEGAEIYYSVNGEEFAKYDDEAKVVLDELPATIRAYAAKEGLTKSITVNYQYTQAQVATVKASPNGGAVFEGQFVSFKTATEGAHILYRYKTAEEIAEDEKSEEAGKSDAAETTETTTSEELKENSVVETDKTAETTDASEATETTKEAEEEQHDDWIEYSGSIKLENLPCEMQVKAVLEGYKESPVTNLKFTKRLNEKYNIYFGQIHAHTNISDGAGSLDDALKHASNVDNLDYIVITDHSNSIDNEKESKITENVDKSENDEWTYAHNLVKQYSTDEFTCAYGYEMTWSNGLGHMNTYNTPGFQSRTQTAYSTYSTALENYYAALRTVPDSISQFNHPGTTFGDFQDFSYYTEENDALITMIEVGNGEGTIGSSGYFPSYEYYTRALDKGWHVAPTNNQDNHKGKWGDANTARTVMLADTNDETAIYDAMRNYRIYATEDNDLSIYYTLDGNIMGTILEKDAVGDYLNLKADIVDPTDSSIGKVEVIVNGGQSIAQQTVAESEATVEFTVPSAYSYYYLKITENDGDIAVTAPVWVGNVEACGINRTYTSKVLAVAGESLDVNVELYNNEEKDLVIDSIEIQLSDVDAKKTDVVNVTGEEAGITAVAPNGTATYKTDFVYDTPGQVTYEVTVNATLNGVPKKYTDKLTLSYVVPEMVTDVLIDGTHYNDYVTGYYGGNMSSFIKICAQKNIRAQVVTSKITPETLEKCSLLVLSAPAKKSGTANAGDYTVSHYEDDFLAMVKDYVEGGGSVIVCGLADYSDTTDGQTVTEQNKLLEAIGATIRMGSDEVCDDTNNGGQVYRMYPTTYNVDEAAGLFAGLRDGQKYSQYSGCSVDISNATETDFVDAAKWLVKGFDTTYSVDCKDASGNANSGVLPNGVKGIKNDNEGNVTFLATQHTKAGGDIYVAGGVFVSDFEVKAEMDNNDSLPYTNHTIINNILDGVTVELPTSTIAQARAGQMNEVFAVEGYVTSGTSNPDTTFFDTIYIQDETAGIDIFPYATAGLEIGTKVRITGFVAQYQGDMELKVISSKILDDEPYVWEPKVVDTKTAMDYAALGGSLLKTTGKVTRVAVGADGNIEEFWLADDTGVEAAIFIDGYIKSGTTGDEGKAALNDFVKVGAEVSAAGVLYMHPEGDSDVSVPVFRVRNCDDIVKIADAQPPVLEKCAAIVATPESGEVAKNTVVTLSCETEGAVIKYSINDGEYKEYSDGIKITENVTVQAYATAEGYEDGDQATFTYTVKEEPQPTPPSVEKVVQAVVQSVVKAVTTVVNRIIEGISRIFRWFR